MRRHLGPTSFALPPRRGWRRPARARILAGALAALLALAGQASAQTAEEIRVARQTANEGLEAYRSGEFYRALGLFEQARAVYASAQILRMVGYTHLALEHWDKATEALEASLTSTVNPLPEADRKDVQEQLNKALAHYGTLEVTSTVAGAALRLNDGPPQDLPLDKPLLLLEGKYIITVTAPDRLDATEEVTIGGGKTLLRPIDPAPRTAPPPKAAPPPPPPPPPPRKPWLPHQRPIGYALGGTGLALGASALITVIAGETLRGKVVDDVAAHKLYFGDQCARGDRLCAFDMAVINYDADRVDALRKTSIGLFIGAGVLFAGGAALVLTAPRDTASARPRAAVPSMQCGPAGLLGLTCGGRF